MTAIKADVVVFGAGVSGLTVAHELAERNFKVVVVDPAITRFSPNRDAPEINNPGLGGMARSQWGFVGNDQFQPDPLQEATPAAKLASTAQRPPRALVICWRMGKNHKLHFDPPADAGDGGERGSLAEALDPFIDCLKANRAFTVSVIVKLGGPQSASDGKAAKAEIFAHIEQQIAKRFSDKKLRESLYRRFEPSDGVVDGDDGQVLLDFNVFALPGEHGFRFFPSFYRHLFDTMRRIPLMCALPVNNIYQVDGRLSVYDNLLPVDRVAYVGNRRTPSLQISRKKTSSQDMRNLMRGMLTEGGYSSTDLDRLTDKFLRYATSSRQRREREYEKQSWWELIEGDRFSRNGRRLVETSPGTLGGLFGSQADARTQGTIALQCLKDQTGDGGQTDMLLDGPTDLAWFGHWYRYLDREGVEFHQGMLTGFAGNPVQPLVTIDGKSATFEPVQVKDVMYVIALPLAGTAEVPGALAIAERFPAGKGEERPRDFAALLKFCGESSKKLLAGLTKPYPQGPLRHLSGIQYFFVQDLQLWRAHTQYLDAPSGLTAIAQPQFWYQIRDVVSGFRSLLSVDVATWARPTRDGVVVAGTSPHEEDYPWGKTRQKIAELIWEQLELAHAGDFPGQWPRLPEPIVYHLDDNLLFDEETGALCGDNTPFLVNVKERYRLRPGMARKAEAPAWKVTIDYDLADGRFVMAGTHMQTYTRITSMEAACESGRHAANAILKKLNVAGERCAIWDPEDFEAGELDFMKQLDDRLCSEGRPHPLASGGELMLDDWAAPVGARWLEWVKPKNGGGA